jgi:hypothetical protein
MSAMLFEITCLRDKALLEVCATPAYDVLLALDKAVVAAGGVTVIASANPIPVKTVELITPRSRKRGAVRKAQADFASDALTAAGEPLHIGRFVEATLEAGGSIGGDQVANLRSTLSRDPRFVSIMCRGMYFWWFTDRALPAHWNTEGGLDLAVEPPAVSSYSSEEGGGGHAANNTNLAS